jgi:hypothetical protein
MPSRFEIEPPIKRRGQKSALYKAQRSGQATPSRPHKLDRRVTFMDIAHYSKEDQLEFIESENNKVNRNYLKEHKIKQKRQAAKKKQAFENKKSALKAQLQSYQGVDHRGRIILNEDASSQLPCRRQREQK